MGSLLARASARDSGDVSSGLDALERVAVARLGKGQVQLGQELHGAVMASALVADQGAESAQDAVDLVLLLELQLVPAVVQSRRWPAAR